MTFNKACRAVPPLDAKRLEELALRYVGRYATTRAKLCAYLGRKLRERGWSEPGAPDVAALAARFAELGYIDDAAFALSKAQGLSARGYGKRRLLDKLRIAGVGEADSRGARNHADGAVVDSALRFARRRRIGPFAAARPEPREREKAIAAMVRAGHSFALARAIAELAPGAQVDGDELRERARLVAE